jgi:HSP20 family protein
MTNLVRWEPLRDLISLREAMDRLFEESFLRPQGGWMAPVGAETLAVDMYETDDAIIVKSSIPDAKPEDLDISVTGDTLTIKGETKTEEEVRKENYIRRERRYGSFYRALTIPIPIVADKAEAEFENGVLRLTLPKAEEVRPKGIKVKAKGRE